MPRYEKYEIEAYYINWGRKKTPVDYEIVERKDVGGMVYMRIKVKVPATYGVHVVVKGE